MRFFIMKSTKISSDKIKELRKDYLSGLPLKELRIKHTILDNRTIKKYLSDLLPDLSDFRVISVYKACGNLDGAAKILGISRTAVWRRLTKNNIEVGSGSKDWKKLYNTIRARATRSLWRKNILERDNYRCVNCGKDSCIVHHVTKLSNIRDSVLKNYPDVNPLNSYQELRKFTDLVMEAHNEIGGITLCNVCHDLEHSKK